MVWLVVAPLQASSAARSEPLPFLRLPLALLPQAAIDCCSILRLVPAAGQPRSTLFTGSKRVAEKLAKDFHGRVGAWE